MQVEIIQEAGYEVALLGLGLSFGKTSDKDIKNIHYGMVLSVTCQHLHPQFYKINAEYQEAYELYQELKQRAVKLAHKQGGHNKFLESIMLWVDVTAPLYWWKQADTYRISTKQSESTMHTIMKESLSLSDFMDVKYPEQFQRHIDYINTLITDKEFDEVIKNLPDSFLQRRIWCMSYKTLQNIINQRSNHKLDEWKLFCNEVLKQAKHPEFLKRSE